MRGRGGVSVREREYTMSVFEHLGGQQQLGAGVRRFAATVVVLT
jgi:hypothetical protein